MLEYLNPSDFWSVKSKSKAFVYIVDVELFACPPADLFLDETGQLPRILDFLCIPSGKQPPH